MKAGMYIGTMVHSKDPYLTSLTAIYLQVQEVLQKIHLPLSDTQVNYQFPSEVAHDPFKLLVQDISDQMHTTWKYWILEILKEGR